MKLLALETSTQACSVAINIDGDIVEQFRVIPREHARQILPMINTMLAQTGMALTQFDGIAYGNGPGSFTGLRIAASIAQGLAFGAELPVLPVSSLTAMARGVWRMGGHNRCLIVQDAHMGEFFWAVYQLGMEGDGSETQVVTEPQLTLSEHIAVPQSWEEQAWVGAGDGWHKAAAMKCQAPLVLPECYSPCP